MIPEDVVILSTKKEENIILAWNKHNSAIFCYVLVTYLLVLINLIIILGMHLFLFDGRISVYFPKIWSLL
jgi:hypothetical protein